MENKRDNIISFTKYTGIDNIEHYYETLDIIGSGSFGIVYKAKCVSDGNLWAIKRTERTRTTYSQWEIHLMSIMKHNNIVFVRELIETDKYSFVVMELCTGGSLKDHFVKVGQFTEPEVKHIMIQFTDALHYLHSSNIAHRDLKMENLLLQSVSNLKENIINDNKFISYVIKLIDFGLSVKLKTTKDMMLEYCGTLLYMPPEIIKGKSYSKQCDIWSMGIVMYSLMLGKLPFVKSDNLIDDILNFNIDEASLSEELINFSQTSIDALKTLLNSDPSYRCSASEFMRHPWLTGMGNGSTNVLILMKQMAHSMKANNLSTKPSSVIFSCLNSEKVLNCEKLSEIKGNRVIN